MKVPHILFGVGATKAGTSWLHEWLAAHPGCHFRSVKEVHYFDTLESGKVRERHAELESERRRLIARKASEVRIRDVTECLSLFEKAPDGQAYLTYLNGGRTTQTLIGDITPSYGLLPVGRLQMMAALGETRFLYILRDPATRLWSHVRMIAGRREPDGEVTKDRAARILKRALRGDEDHIVIRGNYRGVMDRLAEAVPEARRLFVFFEELVSGEAVGRVCDFLGIAPARPLARVVHAGQPLPMEADQICAARAFLRDQYNYVESVMGRLPDAWRQTEKAT